MQPGVKRIIKDIKTLKIQGAREVAKAGIRALEVTAKSSKAKSKRKFVSDLQNTHNQLIKSRPTEPALQNISRNIILSVHQYHGTYDLAKIKAYTLGVCGGYVKVLAEALVNIGRIGADLITDGDIILTHCHSHSVVQIFKEAKKQGKKFSVIVTETRPRNQGILTINDLNESGINTILCVDSAIGFVMKSVTKCLTGSDSFFPDGSVANKIGTFPIAIVANKFGVPFIVAGGTYKYTSDVNLAIERRNPDEIIDHNKIKKTKIINPAFDVTPAELISIIITEKGVVEPSDFAKHVEV